MDPTHPFSILIVDDNPLNLRLLETILAKEGYGVFTAPDGPAARKAAAGEKPNLILLDIKMPGEDGFSVIKSLKINAATAGIPVIFLSGISEIEAKLSGFELGAVDYITKPFHPLEVLARVRLHLKLSIATNSMIQSQALKLKQVTEAQTALLATPGMYPDAKFGAYYLTLQEAGGDFYDVLPISRSIFGYLVADFSGHDIKTSYLTAAVKALLKQNTAPIYQPLETIKLINDVLTEILPEGKYLTACYARLNRQSRMLHLINAGHPPAIYMRSGGHTEIIEIKGDILGIFKNVYFGEQLFEVSPGDRLFLYTDGLVESSKERVIWANRVENIAAACETVRDTPIAEAPREIVRLLRPEPERIEDDIVVLGIEI